MIILLITKFSVSYISSNSRYLGLMALAGIYLVKDSIHYFFVKIEDKKQQKKPTFKFI